MWLKTKKYQIYKFKLIRCENGTIKIKKTKND